MVVIADPRTVLKTSSGNIRRSAMREAYLKGTLGAHQSVAAQRARLLAGALGAWTRRSGTWLGRVIFTSWIILVLVLSLPVLWAYLAVRPPGRHADRAARRWSRLSLTLCGLRPHVAGLEHLRTSHPASSWPTTPAISIRSSSWQRFPRNSTSSPSGR